MSHIYLEYGDKYIVSPYEYIFYNKIFVCMEYHSDIYIYLNLKKNTNPNDIIKIIEDTDINRINTEVLFKIILNTNNMTLINYINELVLLNDQINFRHLFWSDNYGKYEHIIVKTIKNILEKQYKIRDNIIGQICEEYDNNESEILLDIVIYFANNYKINGDVFSYPLNSKLFNILIKKVNNFTSIKFNDHNRQLVINIFTKRIALKKIKKFCKMYWFTNPYNYLCQKHIHKMQMTYTILPMLVK
jgi:hypothetical protein